MLVPQKKTKLEQDKTFKKQKFPSKEVVISTYLTNAAFESGRRSKNTNGKKRENYPKT